MVRRQFNNNKKKKLYVTLFINFFFVILQLNQTCNLKKKIIIINE